METAQITIEGMHCDGCVRSVTRSLGAVPGVGKVDVSLAAGTASVRYDPARAGLAELRRAVERAGFKAP
jgi:copper chaperone